MEVKLRVADPAGNITIFVTSPVERNLYAKVANELLAIKEFRGEQVGFIERHEDGSRHMEMMGGEFCGNATRSFGYLLGKEQEPKDAYKKTVTVDVSGSSKKLDVEVDYEAGTSKTMMPLPEKIEEVETAQYGSYPMVVFDGINHVIVKGPRREDAFVQAVLEAAMAKHKCDACGIMFLEPSADGMEKSSCGSGSMATAVYLSKQKNDGKYVYILKQPGGIIEATVVKENGKTVECKMGGPVSVSLEKTVEVKV